MLPFAGADERMGSRPGGQRGAHARSFEREHTDSQPLDTLDPSRPQVADGAGLPLGPVVDTYPFDGGEVEMVVVRLDGAFGGRRMLPVEELADGGYALRTPFARWQVEDSPRAQRRPPRAPRIPTGPSSYWRFEEPDLMLRAA